MIFTNSTRHPPPKKKKNTQEQKTLLLCILTIKESAYLSCTKEWLIVRAFVSTVTAIILLTGLINGKVEVVNQTADLVQVVLQSDGKVVAVGLCKDLIGTSLIERQYLSMVFGNDAGL
jgi:hypothetical protein